jgi:hypothetical protein
MNDDFIMVDNLMSTIKKLTNILWNEPEDIISIKEKLSVNFVSDYNENCLEPALEWLIFAEWIEKRRGFFCLTTKGRKELPFFSPDAVYPEYASV